ncbi:MAG: dethiobiotin synthase [Piscirickettsiaceae bacterium]|nr:dethiobiotin synthase [Piscirickettsiaceae bacterium]
MSGLFVTGTDTDVGKTRISIALIELLQQQGQHVACMKPVASGCEQTAQGLRNDDALALMAQANVHIDYDTVNPYAFNPAIAPHIAAQQVGINIDLSRIKEAYQQIASQADAVIVEGAGGWLVPLNSQKTMADLALELGLPVILVVDIRLGCINHALLTVAAINQTGLSLIGWVANQRRDNEQAAEIIDTLQHAISAPCLGIVPQLEPQKSAVEFLTMDNNK